MPFFIGQPPPPLRGVAPPASHAGGCCCAGYALEKKSSIIGIGLTIANTPVDLREKMAVPEAEWPRAIAELCAYPHIEEAAVLSTCNRMELYVVALSWNRGVSEVRTRRLVGVCSISVSAWTDCARRRQLAAHPSHGL